MEKRTISTELTIYSSEKELSGDNKALLEKARDARESAYAPYSEFHVGASLLLEDGSIVSGSNQENMAYPSGLCAERVAFFYYGAHHRGKKIVRLAITASSTEFPSDHPVTPCGACRQAMLEYELLQNSPIQILMQGSSGNVFSVESVQELLPLFFLENGLKKH